MGHKPGDKVTVETGAGNRFEVSVLSVETTELTEEDKIRAY